MCILLWSREIVLYFYSFTCLYTQLVEKSNVLFYHLCTSWAMMGDWKFKKKIRDQFLFIIINVKYRENIKGKRIGAPPNHSRMTGATGECYSWFNFRWWQKPIPFFRYRYAKQIKTYCCEKALHYCNFRKQDYTFGRVLNPVKISNFGRQRLLIFRCFCGT